MQRREDSKFLEKFGVARDGNGSQLTMYKDRKSFDHGHIFHAWHYANATRETVLPSPAHKQAYRKHVDLKTKYALKE